MITKEAALDKIGKLLAELIQQYENLAEKKESPSMEYELFEVNAVYFADYVKLVNKLHALQKVQKEIRNENIDVSIDAITDETNEATEVDIQSNEAEEKEEIESTSINTEEVYKSEKQDSDDDHTVETKEESLETDVHSDGQTSPSSISQQILVEAKEFSLDTDDTQYDLKKEEPAVGPNVTPVTSSSSRVESINDRMSVLLQSQDTHSGNKRNTNSGRIHNIKTSVSLNDKLLFIKDLFNGYSLAYSEAIELLDRYESFEEADQFLMSNYAEKNNWDNKKDTVDKLYTILRKRFS